ncbi:hypothetical protein C8J56DRAFT_891183 [Mycena floridula]|nr:hypothetical protein C8J56DRAFT_891183 [Mycena floridula]
MPSPVKGPASRKALAAENAQLRDIAQAAGVQLEKNFAQMMLMDHENGRLRKQLHAKKNPVRRAYNTGKARLMTSEEMLEVLLHDEQKKLMKVLHQGMASSLKAIKKRFSELEKAVQKAAARGRGRGRGRARGRSRAHRRGRGRGQDNGGSDSNDELPPAPARGRGQRGQRRGRGRGRGRGHAQDGDSQSDVGDSDDQGGSDRHGDSESPSDSGSETSRSRNPSPSPSPSRFIVPLPPHEIALPPDPDTDDEAEVEPEQPESDDDEGPETEITLFNGHRWFKKGRNLEFQVLWSDKDVTWEPLSNVNDCRALEDYLDRFDLTDPLLLSKRKYFIDPSLKSSN